MKTYEYQWLHIPTNSNAPAGVSNPDVVTRLNEAGQNGWEFTGEIVNGYCTSLYFMKRVVKVKKAKKPPLGGIGGLTFDEAMRSLSASTIAMKPTPNGCSPLTSTEIDIFGSEAGNLRSGRIVFTITDVNNILTARRNRK